MREPKVYCHTCLHGISCFPLLRSATTLLLLPLAIALAMATPPPGFVRDLTNAFDQAGAPVTAPIAGVAPAQTAVAAAAPPPVAPVPPPLPPPPSAAAPVPLDAMPPAAAGFFMPPVQPAQAVAVAPAASFPALAVAAPAHALVSVFINQHVLVVLFLNPSTWAIFLATWWVLFYLSKKMMWPKSWVRLMCERFPETQKHKKKIKIKRII
jgi:hypothetical protein